MKLPVILWLSFSAYPLLAQLAVADKDCILTQWQGRAQTDQVYVQTLQLQLPLKLKPGVIVLRGMVWGEIIDTASYQLRGTCQSIAGGAELKLSSPDGKVYQLSLQNAPLRTGWPWQATLQGTYLRAPGALATKITLERVPPTPYKLLQEIQVAEKEREGYSLTCLLKSYKLGGTQIREEQRQAFADNLITLLDPGSNKAQYDGCLASITEDSIVAYRLKNRIDPNKKLQDSIVTAAQVTFACSYFISCTVRKDTYLQRDKIDAHDFTAFTWDIDKMGATTLEGTLKEGVDAQQLFQPQIDEQLGQDLNAYKGYKVLALPVTFEEDGVVFYFQTTDGNLGPVVIVPYLFFRQLISQGCPVGLYLKERFQN